MSSFSRTTEVSSTSTLQRIPTSQLRQGMFLVRVLDSWWKSPFFTHRRLLKSPAEIQQLLSSGIKEVEIDTSLGVSVSSNVDAYPEVVSGELTDASHTDSELNTLTPDELATESIESSTETKIEDEAKNREELALVRDDVLAAVEGMFDGVKTGQPISQPALHAASQVLVQKALMHPTLLAEILLVDALKHFDKTLYAHVVDTAVYSILVGLQLGWEQEALEKLGVGALLHDVGYMRLPQNVVKAYWNCGNDFRLLQQHVVIGETLIQRQEQFSKDIVRMVAEHHAYQDGSGYAKSQLKDELSEFGQLLGVMDYFDELLTVGGTTGSLPAALAIRRMYQEAQKGKFSTRCIEAMIRTFGVFPVGTPVQLSIGEQAVVVKQNLESGLKPQVKIFRDSDGTIINRPWLCDLVKDSHHGPDVSIVKVLEPAECAIDPKEYL